MSITPSKPDERGVRGCSFFPCDKYVGHSKWCVAVDKPAGGHCLPWLLANLAVIRKIGGAISEDTITSAIRQYGHLTHDDDIESICKQLEVVDE